LLASKQRYTQYYTLELQWKKKQTRLIQINQEISAAEQQTLQIEEETRNTLLIQQGLSALLTHTIDWSSSAIDDILKRPFQYLAETANAHQFMRQIDDCLQIIRQQGLPSPPEGQLLQEAVQLQEMLPVYKNIWVQSKQQISQTEKVIAGLDTIEQQRQTVEHSLQNTKNLLARFPTQIDQAQIVLQKQQVVTQTLENAMTLLKASKPESLASIFQQFLDREVTAQLAAHGPLNSLDKEKILPRELLAAGRLEASIEFMNIWNVANTIIQERSKKALIEIDAYRQASAKFSSLKEAFTEHWKNLPAFTNGLILEKFASPSQQEVHYDSLIKRIEQNLSIIVQFRMRNLDASGNIFQNYNKHQIQKLLLETRTLFFAADESLKHTLDSIRTSNATCTTTAAHNFSAALNHWLTQKLQEATVAQQAILHKKELMEGERQQLRQSLVNEEAQLTRLLQTRTRYENQLSDAFYQLGQSAGISEALRQIAQQNASPVTVPLIHTATTQHKTEFVPAYRLCYQQWQSETERLETLIEDLWKTLEGLHETINQPLSQLHELREQQKHSLQDLYTQRDALQVILQQNPLALQNGRVWWHTFWAKIPEHVRPQVPAEDIYVHDYLEAVRAQFTFWEQELAREELVARQYDGLITDWISALQTLSEHDKRDLKETYIKNAPIIAPDSEHIQK